MGFIFYVADENFQSEDLKFSFEEDPTVIPTRNSAFCLTNHSPDDKDNGIMVDIDYHSLVHLTNMTRSKYDDCGEKESSYFFSWHKCWKRYHQWLGELQDDPED